MINKTHAFILSNLEWIGVDFLDLSRTFEKDGQGSRQIRVLDYACGPGTMTSALQGYATEFVGVDISEQMVKSYNERFNDAASQSEAITPTAKAVVGDLLDSNGPSESISGTEFFDFDLVVVGYGFHHFEDLELATSRFASRLKPGGVLLIVDLITHAKVESDNPAKNVIAHYGFGEEEVKSIFGTAGLVDVAMLEMEGTIEMKKPGARDDEPGQRRKAFFGRGRKPT